MFVDASEAERRRTVALFVCLGLVLAACPADRKAAPSAAAELDAGTPRSASDAGTAEASAPSRPPPLRVAMSGTYMPLHGSADGKAIGYEADLARALGEALGREVVFLERAELGSSTLEAVARGRADVALSAITPTAARAKTVSFTSPYLYLLVRLGARQAQDGTVHGKRVALVDGPWTQEVKGKLQGAEVVVVKSPRAAFALLDAGSADLVVGEDVGLLNAAGQRGVVLLDRPILAVSAIALAAPKGQAGEYEAWLQHLSATREALERKWNVGVQAAADAAITTLIGVCERGVITLVGAHEPQEGLTAVGTEAGFGDRMATEEEQQDAQGTVWYEVQGAQVIPTAADACHQDGALVVNRRVVADPPPGWSGPARTWAKVPSDPPLYLSARRAEWIEECTRTDSDDRYECGERGYEVAAHDGARATTRTIVTEKFGD